VLLKLMLCNSEFIWRITAQESVFFFFQKNKNNSQTRLKKEKESQTFILKMPFS